MVKKCYVNKDTRGQWMRMLVTMLRMLATGIAIRD